MLWMFLKTNHYIYNLMSSLGYKTAMRDKKYLIDKELERQRELDIIKFVQDIKTRSKDNDNLLEILEEYKGYINSLIHEKKLQISALDNILKHLDSIEKSGIPRHDHQIEEDKKERKNIRKDIKRITSELDNLSKITEN